MKFYFFLFLLFSVFPLAVLASSARIGKIVITGNKIVERSAIRSKIFSKVNEKYATYKVRRDVRQIFNTGWFYDVEVQKKEGAKVTLVYIVKEKPIVEKIIYKGNDSLSKKELDEIFHFLPHEFLDHKKVKRAMKSIKEEYEKKGYYLAEISYSIEKTSHPEKVRLILQIEENKKVKVKRVNFIGNQAISSKEITSFMGTKEFGLLSFLSSAGSYSRDILEKDLNNIRFIYMDRGYWKVFVGKPDIVISPDKTNMTIHIPIQEGEQYKAGTIDFSGDLIFEKELLKKDLETEELEVFSYGKLQRDIKRLETKYGDEGYAFVNVIPKFFNLPGDDNKTIHVLFEIRKGKKVKIGQIHITGNSYTRDKVIRREIRIFEGELYNETDKNRSAENIQRLGFFDDVKIISKTIKNRDDLVDMEVNIKERENTGTLELGAQYAEYGFAFNGKIHKYNLFGKGYNMGFDATVNQVRQYINLQFSDPYFLDSRWYFGGDFYFEYWSGGDLDKERKQVESKCQDLDFRSKNINKELQEFCLRSIPDINYRGFSEEKISGGVTFGRSLSDSLKLLLYYRMEMVWLRNTIDTQLYPVAFSSGLRNPVEAIVEYDKRNDRLFPTAGLYSRGSVAYDGIFGKFNYFTLSANVRFYQKLFWDFVFRMNVQYSEHLAIDGHKTSIPIDRLFLLGGINNLRGFQHFTVGPRKESNSILEKAEQYGHPNPKAVAHRVFGGVKEFYTNLELQFPIVPGTKLLGVLFVDTGNAYDEWHSIGLRWNWGFGLRVFSPVGPLRFEMGFPFQPDEDKGEQLSQFQFTMGLPF